MKNYCDGGEAILQALRNLDVDYVFSSPGSEWGALWEAVARQQIGNVPGPKYLSCWHETLAVDLAIGYTAATGRMQAVVLHAGVGVMQGSMGVYAARMLGLPMVVMSGEALTYGDDESFDPGAQWYRGLSIVGGPQKILQPYLKWSTQATSSATLHEMVVRAGEIAERAPAGPTYLNVPIEVMADPWTPPVRMRKVPRAAKLKPTEADVAEVAKRLVAAEFPVITTEAAGREPEGYRALIALAERLAIPVVEGMGSDYSNFPKDHPLHQGYKIRPFLQKADLVLAVRARTPWYPPSKGPANAAVVVIDDVPFREFMVYQNLQADMLLEGHVPYSLEMLADAVGALGVDDAKVAARRTQWAAAHRAMEEELRMVEAKAAKSDGIHPATLCRAFSNVLPTNTIYVDETTTQRNFNQAHIDFRGPQSYFRVPGGLGQGLGMALGVKLANRSRPVCAMIGDGAFLYNPALQSLGFSRDADLPILIVVYNNGGYRAMKKNQLSYYPDGCGAEHRLFPGESLNAPDFAEFAKPFGGIGIRVETETELKPALEEGLTAVQSGKLAILNVHIA